MRRRSSTPRALLARLVRRLAVATVLTAGVAVAGCGAAPSAGTAGSGSTTAANQQDTARVKLQTCLRKQGVNLPNAGGGGGAGGGGAQLTDADRQKLQTAMQGPCKSLQSQAFGNISDSQRQQFQDAFTKFSACMRQHGVDVPTPTAGSGGGPPAGGNRIDQSDPKVKAAMTACQDKLPQGRPGGAPGGARD